jgi:acyl-CoA reductase-like NAD-dependent aldehyde dehydrogenase
MTIDTDFKMTIDGRDAVAQSTFAALDPATNERIASVPDATREQLDAAVSSARRAFESWSCTPLPKRQALVAKIAGVMMGHVEELAALLTREQGKPLDKARTEILAAAHWCAEFAKLDMPVHTLQDTATSLAEIRRMPMGVVGAIVPWNFPIVLAFWKIAPALVAGNTMVLKPSPFTPLTTLRIGALLRDVLPPGVLNVISGGDALGPWMTQHPGIDKISFTGSTQTGRKVMESASVNLKRLTLELGGNDACIVMPDIDVDAVAPLLFWGAFTNSGQFCMAIKRLFIHEDIYDRLSASLVRVANETKMGVGTQQGVMLGPVQNKVQFERLKNLLADTRHNGYHILVGGEIPESSGNFFPVTLVDNPPDDSRIVREEPFGPILPLLKFKTVDEVVARANQGEFGLGGSVWSEDEVRALEIAHRLQTGTVWINEIHTFSPLKPTAGHKQSGVGVENGTEGLMEYTLPKLISLKRAA